MSAVVDALRGLGTQIRGAVVRGVVTLVRDDLKGQRVQVTAWGVPLGEAEIAWPYGLTAVPPTGSEVVTLSIGAVLGHLLGLPPFDRRYRPTGGASGDVVLYHYQGGKVALRSDGVHIEGNVPVFVDSSDVRLGTGANAALSRFPELKAYIDGHTHSVVGAVPVALSVRAVLPSSRIQSRST